MAMKDGEVDESSLTLVLVAVVASLSRKLEGGGRWAVGGGQRGRKRGREETDSPMEGRIETRLWTS